MAQPQKVLILILSYHAKPYISDVLRRIPENLFLRKDITTHIHVQDDASADDTYAACAAYQKEHPGLPLTAERNADNLGYGGNQKKGYALAVSGGYDVVVLLHGDGQYPPETIPELIQPLLEGKAEAVLGSRMARKRDALKGGMPLYKFAGNVALTGIQNLLLGTRLSEYHTGFRAYSVHTLARLPIHHNSDYFDFDTDILIQLADTGSRVVEIPIPTRYGEEKSHVSCARYGTKILWSTVLSRLQRLGLWHHPKFDYGAASSHSPPRAVPETVKIR